MIGLTLQELAARIGEAPERVEEWRGLGLIGAKGAETFDHLALEQARLVQYLCRHGIAAGTIARARADRRLATQLEGYFDLLFPGAEHRGYSLVQAAQVAGLDAGLAARLWQAVTRGRPQDALGDGDIEMLRSCQAALEVLPEEALLQVVRTLAEALGRAAEVVAKIFHFYSAPRIPEVSTDEVLSPVEQVAQLEPAILYFLRRGFLSTIAEDLVMHLGSEATLVEGAPGRMNAAIAFLDLSSFTPLADSMGDVAAAEVLSRFANLVRDACGRWGGRTVKQIGDAFMLVFFEPRSALSCCLEVVEKARGEPRFPAVRGGVHWGGVLYREGDYVGANVNLAARAAAEAGRHEIVVTASLRAAAGELNEGAFTPLGSRELKGVGQPVELFALRSLAVHGHRRADPICGMELGEAEIAARLTVEGVEHVFCSRGCLLRFFARQVAGG